MFILPSLYPLQTQDKVIGVPLPDLVFPDLVDLLLHHGVVDGFLLFFSSFLLNNVSVDSRPYEGPRLLSLDFLLLHLNIEDFVVNFVDLSFLRFSGQEDSLLHRNLTEVVCPELHLAVQQVVQSFVGDRDGLSDLAIQGATVG